MDIFAHSLWTNAVYKGLPQTRYKKTATRWGIFFGVFPDLFSFTPLFAYLIYEMLFRGFRLRLGDPQESPIQLPLDGLTHQLYNLSHSLVIWAAVFLIAWVLFRKVPWLLLGWGIHVAIDIVSHSSQFYPTPFLYPISKFYVNGIPWAEPTFMLANYGLLFAFYVLILPWRWRKST